MNNKSNIEQLNAANVTSWLLGIVILTIGVLNLVLVHPVPGIVFLLLSLVYFPPANTLSRKLLGTPIPLVLKIILGIVTVLSGVAIWLAALHQAVGALLVASTVWAAHILGQRTKP